MIVFEGRRRTSAKRTLEQPQNMPSCGTASNAMTVSPVMSLLSSATALPVLAR